MLQKEDYYNELYELIVDEQKFQKISRDPTTEIKTELYKIIGRINQETNLKLKKTHGHFEPAINRQVGEFDHSLKVFV